ncbi:MAG: GPW/gp25 family protein [Deltaproteobacteria bacterium]|nr:GPW/gp25 family protein [Deltaproteobacteria bacterium]
MLLVEPGPLTIAPADLLEDVRQNVRLILTTPKGSLVLDRDFGLDFSVIDQPLPRAQALLAAEIVDQVARFEPRADVVKVTFEPDLAGAADGKLIPHVRLRIKA